MKLVVGATGLLGSEICRQFTATGTPVRALVRATSDPSKVDALESDGAEIAVGDVRDRGSLDAACHDVTSVISTVSSVPFTYKAGENDIQTVDQEGLENLIDAAKSANVRHFVYTSFSSQIDLDFPLSRAKRFVERRLKASGLTYTILQPSYFMEIWLSPAVGFDFANAEVQIYGTGKNPISWISSADVARFAVRSLTSQAARNTTLMLGGPKALSPLEVVRIFEEVGGRSFTVQHVPDEALAAQQEEAEDPLEQSFAGLMRCYAKGDAIDMDELLAAFPIELTSVHEYTRRVLHKS